MATHAVYISGSQPRAVAAAPTYTFPSKSCPSLGVQRYISTWASPDVTVAAGRLLTLCSDIRAKVHPSTDCVGRDQRLRVQARDTKYYKLSARPQPAQSRYRPNPFQVQRKQRSPRINFLVGSLNDWARPTVKVHTRLN